MAVWLAKAGAGGCEMQLLGAVLRLGAGHRLKADDTAAASCTLIGRLFVRGPKRFGRQVANSCVVRPVESAAGLPDLGMECGTPQPQRVGVDAC